MFERYTERARRALFFTRYEASDFGSLSIEAEHLLLGLLRENKGLTARVFAKCAMSYDAVRSEMRAATEKVAVSVELPFSEATKNALQLAAAEADRLSHNYIGTEHLLLGLLAEGKSRAAAILMRHGLQLDGVRSQIVSLLNEKPSYRPDYEDFAVEFDDGVVYLVAASVDGYIATRDGGVKWVEPFQASHLEYAARYGSIDAIVVGSRTYQHALASGKWPYPGKPCWVFSARSLNIAAPEIVVTNKSPQDVVADIESRGCPRIWLVGGASLAASFRDAGLIKYCLISVIPVVLGDGIPLFGRAGPVQPLQLIYSKSCSQGVVRNFYVFQSPSAK